MHIISLVAPAVLRKRPAGQGAQRVVLRSAAKKPGAHRGQLSAPAVDEKAPSEHGVHAAEKLARASPPLPPGAAAKPGGQKRHCVASGDAKVPGAQPAQAAAPLKPATAPGSQGRHAVLGSLCPGAAPKRPGAHATHPDEVAPRLGPKVPLEQGRQPSAVSRAAAFE